MASITSSLPDLSSELLTLYHVVDPYLSSILLFHGPVAPTNGTTTISSSRIQAHIFTPAGFQSYSRITISPAAPLYAAVNHLPRDRQGDEVCRGLAVSLLKYFADLPDSVKETVIEVVKSRKRRTTLPKMFDEMHAAELANRMTKVDNKEDVVRDLRNAYAERRIPWVDIDVSLPRGTIRTGESEQENEDIAIEDDEDPSVKPYGKYGNAIKLFGQPVFLPTARLRRAPSQSTNINKSRMFTSSQKEALRYAMCEMVDTEERYVTKLYDLINNVVEDFRQKSRERGPSSTSPSESSLAELFPPCINTILEVNMGFLDAIRDNLEQSEKDAMEYLANDTEISRNPAQRKTDPTGAVSFAQILLEWFPRFSGPYVDYMRAHNSFSKVLNDFMKDTSSSFSRRVQETGDQRLRSMLMEPIQRLPRYSLLIDSMTNCLPLAHPAVKHLLKARDIITEICSLDSDPTTNNTQFLSKLQKMVADWPASLVPSGRLISVVGFEEMTPPYNVDSHYRGATNGMLLLYRDYVILTSRTSGSKLSSRGLLALMDSDATSAEPLNVELIFSDGIPLSELHFSQSVCGRVLYMTRLQPKNAEGPNASNATRVFALGDVYEGKAAKFIEESVKARIEGRFPESEREGGKWALRSLATGPGSLGLLSSVFEDEEGLEDGVVRPRAGSVRVVFDKSRQARLQMLESSDVDIVVAIEETEPDTFRIDVDSRALPSTVDYVPSTEFADVFSKRLSRLLGAANKMQDTRLIEAEVESSFGKLRHLVVRVASQPKSPTKSFRAPSPTKLLSSLWSGHKEPESPTKKSLQSPFMGDIPSFAPPTPKVAPPSPKAVKEPTPELQVDATPKICLVGTNEEQKEDPYQLLEEAFTAYVLALSSRAGNIIGKTLRSRASADEVAVNELYNILLEEPGRIQAAAEVPVDVLFVSFEKFMNVAWKEQIGPVLDIPTMKFMRHKYDNLFPRDFDLFFKRLLEEMAPQCRRAFTAMIKLLAELLDASGNDGDRGALTLAFAEILTEEGDPIDFISLLDRLVEDYEILFEGAPPIKYSDETNGSYNASRSQSAAQSSVNSNTSSFRRRFGFGSHRENSSKGEGENKMASIIRNLSKSKPNSDGEYGTPSPKPSLGRSKSTDLDARINSFLRPNSRDRPGLFGAFPYDESTARPNSSHGSIRTLASIKETPLLEVGEKLPSRRKRRSSLSDLKILQMPMLPAIQPLEPITPPRRMERPKTPDFTTSLQAPRAHDMPSGIPSRLGSPFRPASPRKENIRPPNSKSVSADDVRTPPRDNPLGERPLNMVSNEPPPDIMTPRLTLRRKSNIPAPRLQYRDRANTTDGTSLTLRGQKDPAAPKTPRLRMQSPQKLRERLENEKREQAANTASFQTEVTFIGDQMSNLKLSPTKLTGPASGASSLPRSSATGAQSVAALAARIHALEATVSSMTSESEKRSAALAKDVETSLAISERRAKKLDELYKEASAENEALYERFNTELSKLAKAIRSGDGEEVFQMKFKETLDDAARMKKENLRLKREVGGLRAVVGGHRVSGSRGSGGSENRMVSGDNAAQASSGSMRLSGIPVLGAGAGERKGSLG